MMEKSIGADAQRVDGADKVKGNALFGADRILPRMAYALPVTATIGKGRIRSIDTAEAEAMRGVLVVLTHLNTDRLKPLQFVFAGGHGIQSFQPLQSDIVLYRGQAIALIVADSLEAAQAARSLVRVDYETASFAVELDGRGSETVNQSTALPYFPDFVAGDADRALSTAAITVDETYTTPAQHQNPIELLATVAEWAGDCLIIHESTQASQGLCGGLALQLGIDPASVRVISPYVGGGFGQKNSIAPHTVMAAVAARRVGRPVKLVVPRDQVFHATSFRSAAKHRIRVGADSTGKIIAAIHEMRAQTSRFDLMPFTGAETTSRMYGIPNFRSGVTLVKLDTQTPGFMRAPFEMSAFFALEGAMDELAYKLACDPVELRIANDTHTDPITGKAYTVRRLADCLRRGAQQFGWARRSAEPRSMRDKDGTLIGWGMAAGAYPVIIAAALATVRLNADATAEVWVGGHEMGQGIRTAITLVAAEELGIEPQKIRVTIGDTIAPPQHVTAGAWGTATATPPVLEAARSVRAQLIELAGSKADSPPGSAQYGELLKRSGLSHLDGHAQWFAPGQKPEVIAKAKQGLIAIRGPEFPDCVAFSYIAHFVEVRVNPRIPRARVARIVSVVDCGRVISKRTARSQVYGGLVWGVGAALSEESEVDPRFGGFLNSNIAEYQIPVNADMGSCEVDFIDEPDLKLNSLGVKGLGEIVCVGAAAAVANAVFHATGRRVRDLPIRIEDLM
ncbi:MAG: aldehyde oxidase and xanthine dehydrogenase molybdopterin binding [Betaproteobacteria bacterium]|nr:aldehyde oxidase and xanthine dehydrogenase molybdopterin binding [Betaproteobacteria bacterium]